MRTQWIALAGVIALAGFTPADAQAQQRDNSVGRAATSPLRDARIVEDKIPPVLRKASSAPYSSDGTASCAQIIAQVRELDGALGPDVDATKEKAGEGSAIAATATRGVVSSIIPGLGLVRVITGADKAQRRAEAAVYGGSVRRAYLKGLGSQRKCKAPGAATLTARKTHLTDPPAEEDKNDEKDVKKSEQK